MEISSWIVREQGSPMIREQREVSPAAGEVLIEVAGCGVCHTDLGFFYDGVPTRHPLPLREMLVAGGCMESGPGGAGRMGEAARVRERL